MFGSLGLPELLIIFFVILLLFGAKRLPELAAGLGKGLREFKKAASDVKEELEEATRLDENESGKKKKD
ncbi:MAG TPA: twin-arginine translocase TatA/TatE family subunit [Candidatus Marinimicrobia bacterium]|nr:twin-arginine translocase TatA/TatE family subunit [Candidatus Neomarinimicrobiota bacterium]